MQLKAVSYSVSSDIESRKKIPWPPTPQNILKSDELLELDKALFNLIVWINSPRAATGKNGFVQLSEQKTTKVSEIVQDIQSLVPGSLPGFNQILLSITTLAKTGSQMVINDLKQPGGSISNTETMLIQDKWAEWTRNCSSIIPSNIKKGVIAAHICDNTDCKNKNVNSSKTNHTNSILVQKYDLIENVTKI